MESIEHAKIKSCWDNVRKNTEFKSVKEFYEWSMKNGFTMESRITRRNIHLPHSPRNSMWIPMSKLINKITGEDFGNAVWESIIKYNQTVAKIRQAVGLPQLGGYMGKEKDESYE